MCVYSVVLLDDEELILQSLAGLIDWASLGCYIAATATDGQAGLTILDRLHPDLVITDIRMPGASGLDIARHCARYLPRCRVILLSAYADFHYAQEAIQEGALAYLLKPIDKNELTSVVGRAVDKLREDKTTAAAQEQMQTDMENARTMATSSLLFNLARYGTTGTQGPLSVQAEGVARRPGVVVSLQFFNGKQPVTTTLAEGQRFWQARLQHAGWQPIFGSASEKLILTCVLPGGIARTTARERLIRVMRQIVPDTPETWGLCVACVSPVYHNAETLQQCYRTCLQMLDAGFFCEADSVLDTVASPAAFMPPAPVEPLCHAVLLGQWAQAQAWLAQEKQSLAARRDKPFALERIRAMQRSMARCALQLSMPTEGLWQHTVENENFGARFEVLCHGAEQITQYAVQKSDLIGRACLYLEEHFAENDLSLERVSDACGVNSSYLSRAFKKARGTNFLEYLTDLRIRHAQQLLANTALKTYEIAAQVGFSDPHYFSQVFKKRCGCTPASWRAEARKG